MKAKAILVFLCLNIGISSSYAQWEWLNPYPQGTNLWDIHFVKGTDVAYGLGSSGTIIKSIDGGETWEAITSPAKPRINGSWAANCDICFLTPDLGFFGGKNFVKTDDGGISWEVIGSDIEISAMDFKDENFGFVGMAGYNVSSNFPDGILYKVTEGAHVWEEMPTMPLTRIERISILEDSTLIVAGQQGKVVFPDYKYYFAIARSNDFGLTWKDTIFDSFSGYISDMEFVNNSKGYACGGSGFLVQTLDGGKTWEQINSGPVHHKSMELYGDSIITLSYDGSSNISTDNGVNWISSPLGSEFKIIDIGINDDGDCYAVGKKGALYGLSNGDQVWGNISRNPADRENQALFSIHFPTVETGYTCGYYGNIFKTIDKGEHWEKLNTGVRSNLYSIYALFDDVIFASGDYDLIIRSVDGGENWDTVSAPRGHGILAKISFVSTKFGFASGHGNRVLKTDNYGYSWKNISPGHDRNIYDHVFFDSLCGIVVGANHYAARTVNGGNTWHQLSIAPNGEGNFNSVQFPTRDIGYVLSSEWHIYKTVDGGISWVSDSLSSRSSDFIYFIDEDTGYLFRNEIQKTTNGGLTWFTDELVKNYGFSNVSMSPDRTMYGCGWGGMIMKSDNFLNTTSSGPKLEPNNDLLISIWPNPVKDFFSLKLVGLKRGNTKIDIFSLSGHKALVYDGMIDQNELSLEIDTDSFTPGIYFVTARNGGSYKSTKIIIL